MGQQIEELAQFVAETQWEQIPPAVQQHAKLVLLDTFGVILAGAQQPEVHRLQKTLTENGGKGATVFTRGWPTTDVGRAALLNGIAGRSIELCETNIGVSAQAAVQILPGILAVAESVHSNGREILAALVVAYELAIRVNAGTKRRALAHPNGQAALLGAVAGGGRLRGLSAGNLSTAIRIGANLMMTASYTNVMAGATSINVTGGMCGYAATLAPELALAGFTAQEHAIEQTMNDLVGEGFDSSALLDELGTRWSICRNLFRLRACCNPIYPAIDALERALSALRPRPEDIDRIDIATYRFASDMRNQDPPNYFASKYSLPHAAAALIVKGHLRYESFTETALHDPDIAILRHRVHVVEDSEMSALVPRLKPARVTLILRDGRRTTYTAENDKRVDQIVDESEIREKFRELALLVLTPEGVIDVEREVDRCDQWTSIRDLTELLRRHGCR